MVFGAFHLVSCETHWRVYVLETTFKAEEVQYVVLFGFFRFMCILLLVSSRERLWYFWNVFDIVFISYVSRLSFF